MKQTNSMNLIYFNGLKTYLRNKKQSLTPLFYFSYYLIKNKCGKSQVFFTNGYGRYNVFAGSAFWENSQAAQRM